VRQAPANAVSGVIGLSGRAHFRVARAELGTILLVAANVRRTSQRMILAPGGSVFRMIHDLIGAGLRVLAAESSPLRVSVGDLVGTRFGVVGTELGAVRARLGGTLGAIDGVLSTPVRTDRRDRWQRRCRLARCGRCVRASRLVVGCKSRGRRQAKYRNRGN
jgi:hypothetical protein